MNAFDQHAAVPVEPAYSNDDLIEERGSVGFVDLLTWIGDGKRIIFICSVLCAVVVAGATLLMTDVFTARTTLLPPMSQQQGGSNAALQALGALGGLAGGLQPKTPDELYVSLLKSDSVQRALAARFDLKTRYNAKTYEELSRKMPRYIRATSDKKSGVISLEVDDHDAAFAADLANAHLAEITRVMSRLAVTEAQQRRLFFDKRLNETKENLIKAEDDLRRVQEKSGVIVLDKQAEAMIGAAARVRAQIIEREVQLRVMRTGATEQNPQVQRLTSELAGLRAELNRMESAQGTMTGNALDLPVGRLPEASIDYVRARRELKLQETLLESMVRQFEIARLDEAKEGPMLQQIDVALPPDRKAKPERALIVLGSLTVGLILSSAFVVTRRYMALKRELHPESAGAWAALRRAWRWRR